MCGVTKFGIILLVSEIRGGGCCTCSFSYRVYVKLLNVVIESSWGQSPIPFEKWKTFDEERLHDIITYRIDLQCK